MRGLSLCLFCAFALLRAIVPAKADVGFLYTCDQIPKQAPSAWNVSPNGPPNSVDTGVGTVNGITNVVVAGNGSNVWKCQDASASYCGIWKNANLSGMNLGTGVTIAANIRCEASSPDSSFTLGINKTYSALLFLCVRTDQCLLTDREGVVKASYSFQSDTTNYHRYYLTAKNPPGVGDDQCVWTVYRDGDLVMSCQPGLLENWTASDAFFAGHGGPKTNNIGSGTGIWYFDWIACRTDGAFSPSQWDPWDLPPAPTVTAPANDSTVVIMNPTISWAVTWYDRYEVHLTTTNDPTASVAWDSGQVASTANSVTPANLANGTYYVFVRIRTSVGWGPWSAAGYKFTVDAPTSPPSAPVITAPTPGATINSRNALIAWTGGARDGYEVHINTTNSPGDSNGWDSGSISNKSSDCLTGSLANGSYYAFVRLRNLAGWGEWSAGVTFTISVSESLPGAPTIVTPPNGSNVALQQPVIRWIGDAHDKYEVHINTTNVAADYDGWDSGEVASATDWCDSGVLANGTYYVFARVHNSEGWGPWSAGNSFTVNYTGATMKKGWILLKDDQASNLALLTRAREYHINHVQISHDIMMYAWEPINEVARRNRINQLIDTAHANGIGEVVLWSHDIQFTNMPSEFFVGGKVNLDNSDFWVWMEGQYEQLFTVCPNADGIVFTFSENFTGADFNDRSLTIHTGKTPEDTFAKAIQTLWYVCNRRNKSLYIRTWHGAGVDRWIRNAIMRNDPRIWMMSKATGAADWNVIQEDYDIIGTCVGHPELEELDFAGEYWGMTNTPWAGVEFTKHLWTEFGLPRGVKGMAARIHRDNGSVYDTPNRINLCALDILADYPDISCDDIYDYWSHHWFGAVGNKVASSMKRTFDITNACYNLPTVYPFSYWVACDYTWASTFDLDCVSTALRDDRSYQSGTTAYDLFHGRMVNAANRLGGGVPSTLFGDFSPAYTTETSPTCSVTVVDATNGLYSAPAAFWVEYSTDGGASWTNYTNFIVTAEGSSTNPFHVTANSVPFGQRRAGGNKIRFGASNLAGGFHSQVFTARGLDEGYIAFGDPVQWDGITHPQPNGARTAATTAGGRPCRTPNSASDTRFYFQTDDGFAHDRSPGTVYLQVDYYGNAGYIKPIYDSIWRSDEPLLPVYLSGGTNWRAATWRIDNVNFGHRMDGGSDFTLEVGGGANEVVFISAARLSYTPPAGMIASPGNTRAIALSPTDAMIGWDPVPGAARYQVCRNGVAVGWPTATRFIDSGLSPNTQYAYTVTAFGASNNTSYASQNAYTTTLAAAISPASITSSQPVGTWSTSNAFTFNAVGGFGGGKVAYYQYVWDRSPTHVWTGNESEWPVGLGNPQSGSGWSVWRPTSSPTESAPWLMYEGSTTQRCMSEETTLENGIPTWIFNDQGRVYNTKAKIGLWPLLDISRDTGVTVSTRVRCVDEPSGWYNTSTNFGINLRDCPDIGMSIRPDSIQKLNGQWQAADNGYTYHTYTMCLKNATAGNNGTATYSLFRDGEFVSNIVQGPSGECDWSGPFFGHWRSDATGGWAWQWIAWNNTGVYIPSADTNLSVNASQFGGYYLHIRAFNSDGAPGASADIGPYYYWDGVNPLNPVVTDDGDYTTDNAIHATWTPSSPGVTRYEYAIGAAPGLADVVGFTNANLDTEVTRTGLNLRVGSTYYVTVVAIIGSDTFAGISNGITVAPKHNKLGRGKALIDGDPVAFYGKTVTAVFPDCAYVQEKHGMGLQVRTGRPMNVGDVVDLAGRMAGSDTERRIDADTVIPQQGGQLMMSSVVAWEPVVFSAAGITGSAYGYQEATKAYQWIFDQDHKRIRSTQPIEVRGMNTLGMILRLFGKVTDSGQDYFYLDDGSGVDEFYNTSTDGPAGVRVIVSTGVMPPPVGCFVSVTGISSCYDSSGTLFRLLRVAYQDDIEIIR